MPTTIQTHKTQHGTKREIVKYLISAVLVGVGVASFLVLRAMAPVPESRPPSSLIQQVSTIPAETYGGLLFLDVSGTVVPHREIKVAAEVAGRITKRYPACENGNFVRAGELLLEIDPQDYLLEISTLQAEIRQAEKRLIENQQQIEGEIKNIEIAKSDLEIQQSELERNRRAGRALSQAEMEASQRAVNAARTQLIVRENNLQVLQTAELRLHAAIDLAKLQLERAELNLRRTKVTAPSDGVIVRTLVQEGDFANVGAQLLFFEDTSHAEVLANLTPAELRWLRENAPEDAETMGNGHPAVYQIPKTEVTIFDPNEPNVAWRGVLSRFDGIGRDDVTKTIPVRIMVEQPVVTTADGLRALVRGMYVRSRMEVFTSGAEGNLLSIPEVAVHPNGYVWIVRENRLQRFPVEIVNRTEMERDGKLQKQVVVKNPAGTLLPGDAVVVSPINQPSDGMKVQLEGQAIEEVLAMD